MITKNHLNSLAELTPPKTNMAIENTLFEEVFPIENRDFSLRRFSWWFFTAPIVAKRLKIQAKSTQSLEEATRRLEGERLGAKTQGPTMEKKTHP